MAENIKTPVARLSYPALYVPRRAKNSVKEKYGCTLIFDVGTDLAPLKKSAYDCAVERWGEKGREDYERGRLKKPILDGGDPKYSDKDELGAGKFFIRCFSERKPGVVDRKANIILPQDADELLYAGCYVQASVRPFCYDTDGNKGVSFGLQNVQWVRHGERLAGGPSAQDEFEALPDDDVNDMAKANAAGANPWD